MESNREVFLKMTEEYYINIPSATREMFLASKRIDSDSHDWEENMKDALFADIYQVKKGISKQLQERQYQLRELRIINK